MIFLVRVLTSMDGAEATIARRLLSRLATEWMTHDDCFEPCFSVALCRSVWNLTSHMVCGDACGQGHGWQEGRGRQMRELSQT